MSKFHHICGEDITLSVNRTVAEKRTYDRSTLFSAAPLSPGKSFTVRVNEKGPVSYLNLGITEIAPQEWAEGDQKHPEGMTKTWLLRTRSGIKWVHGHYAGRCDRWREEFGVWHYLSAGDILSFSLCGDRSLSFTYNNVEITRMFTDERSKPSLLGRLFGKTDKPIWVVIRMWVKKLEVLQTEKSLEAHGTVVHAFDIAKLFIKERKILGAYFNPEFDVCFCDICHKRRGDNLVYIRGKPSKKYGLPIGWCKFALKTKPQAEAMKIFEKWHVAFHGTTVDALDKILETGDLLLPGDETPRGNKLAIPQNHWDPDHANPKMKPPKGHDSKKVFLSPSIKYAGCDVYAPKFRWLEPKSKQEHLIRVAFQVRIKPDSYNMGKQTIGAKERVDPLFPNSQLEWSTSRRGVAILVGLLVRVEDMVGNPTFSKTEEDAFAVTQKELWSPGSFMAEIKRDYFHETSNGMEVELKAGEKCLVISQEGRTWQVLHHKVNEPIPIAAHYLKTM